MVWDLRAALLRKGEVESARLDDFSFRERARAMRLLAGRIDPGLDPLELVMMIAVGEDETNLAKLLDLYPELEPVSLRALYGRCRAEARADLIAEIGDPTPHRLA